MEQGMLSITVLKNGVVEVSAPAIIGAGMAKFEAGSRNGYPEVNCLPNGRELKAVILFAGYSITSNKVGDKIEVNIKASTVADKNKEIQALRGNDCQNLSPHQVEVLDRSMSIPFETTTSPRTLDLGNGYSLRWSLAIEKI